MPLLEIDPNPISIACNLGGGPLPWKYQVWKKGGQEGQLEEQREGDMGVRPGIVVYTQNPNTQEARAGESPCVRDYDILARPLAEEGKAIWNTMRQRTQILGTLVFTLTPATLS